MHATQHEPMGEYLADGCVSSSNREVQSDVPLDVPVVVDESSDCCTSQGYLADDERGLHEGIDEVTTFLLSFVSSVSQLSCQFGQYVDHFLNGRARRSDGRLRDVFPICRIPFDIHYGWPLDWSTARREAVIKFGNMSLAALSNLYGLKAIVLMGPPTELQKTVQLRLLTTLATLARRLETHAGAFSFDGMFGSLVGRGETNKYPPLCADQVDVLDKCGRVDPMTYIPTEVASVISQPSLMFPLGVTDIKRPAPLRGGSRDEYVRLLLRQLRSSTVGLVAEANASDGTFAVGKKSTGRQREVWDGSAISEAALVPPKPPLLANPASLIHLECLQSRPLWLSKRDAEVWFDQLKLPPALSSYMGRPAVAVKELLHAGVGIDAIQAYVVDGNIELTNDTKLTPVNLT